MYGQKTGAKPFIIKFRWTVFATGDTVYKATTFVDENGRFYFQRGFTDTTYKEDYLAKKEGDFLLQHRFVHGIDTIHSFNRTHIQYADSGKLVQISSREIGLEDILLEDLTYSYILQVIDFQISDGSVYLLYPEEELNYSHRYTLLRLDSSGSECNFFIFKVESKDFSGVRLTKKDSAFVPLKKLTRLYKNLNKVERVTTNQCLRPGNPWLLIYKDKKFVVSNYCIRKRRKVEKSLGVMSDTYQSFMFLKSRYFKK